MLYREALPLVDRMYITIIEEEFEGDTFLPSFDEDLFNIIYEEVFPGDIPYRYLTYERKSISKPTLNKEVYNDLLPRRFSNDKRYEAE